MIAAYGNGEVWQASGISDRYTGFGFVGVLLIIEG